MNPPPPSPHLCLNRKCILFYSKQLDIYMLTLRGRKIIYLLTFNFLSVQGQSDTNDVWKRINIVGARLNNLGSCNIFVFASDFNVCLWNFHHRKTLIMFPMSITSTLCMSNILFPLILALTNAYQQNKN